MNGRMYCLQLFSFKLIQAKKENYLRFFILIVIIIFLITINLYIYILYIQTKQSVIREWAVTYLRPYTGPETENRELYKIETFVSDCVVTLCGYYYIYYYKSNILISLFSFLLEHSSLKRTDTTPKPKLEQNDTKHASQSNTIL